MAHSQSAWLMLTRKLSRHSEVHSEYVLKYIPGHALMNAPNCTSWHTYSLLGSTLRNTLSIGKILPISFDNMLPCTLVLDPETCWVAGRRHQEAGGQWPVADGGWRMVADIMMSVNIIVQTLSLACRLQWDRTMAYGHGVDNWSVRFCRKGRQLDLGESRSPTQIF